MLCFRWRAMHRLSGWAWPPLARRLSYPFFNVVNVNFFHLPPLNLGTNSENVQVLEKVAAFVLSGVGKGVRGCRPIAHVCVFWVSMARSRFRLSVRNWVTFARPVPSAQTCPVCADLAAVAEIRRGQTGKATTARRRLGEALPGTPPPSLPEALALLL